MVRTSQEQLTVKPNSKGVETYLVVTVLLERSQAMYARAVNVQFQPGKIDEANPIVKDAIIPV